MCIKFTTAEFILRAKRKHGDKYDYSKVDYLGINEKVIIICKEHGDFSQTPATHFGAVRGCQRCNTKWTDSILKGIAKGYKSRVEWERGCPGSYLVSCRRGRVFHSAATRHMKPAASILKRYIYVYEFEDNTAYVGLTWNIQDRRARHESRKHKGKIYKKITKKVKYTFKILKKNVPYDKACDQEEKFQNKYKKEGWALLNHPLPVRALGGVSFWTKKKIESVAVTCMSITDLQRRFKGAYRSASRLGIFDSIKDKIEILNREEVLKKKKNKRRKKEEEAIKLANSCKSRKEFKFKYPKECNYLYKNKLKDLTNLNRKSGKKRVKCIETGKTYDSIVLAAKSLGISRLGVGAVASGKRNHVKGYTFKYVYLGDNGFEPNQLGPKSKPSNLCSEDSTL